MTVSLMKREGLAFQHNVHFVNQSEFSNPSGSQATKSKK